MSAYLSSITLHQQQGVSVATFALQCGISQKTLLKHIRNGRVIGARKHPLTKKWWIYPPAKLITGRML